MTDERLKIVKERLHSREYLQVRRGGHVRATRQECSGLVVLGAVGGKPFVVVVPAKGGRKAKTGGKRVMG